SCCPVDQGREVLALRAEQLMRGALSDDTPRRRGTLVRQDLRVRPEHRVPLHRLYHKQPGGPLEASAVGRGSRDGKIGLCAVTDGGAVGARVLCDLSDLPAGRPVVETGAVGADGLVIGDAHARTRPSASTMIVTSVSSLTCQWLPYAPRKVPSSSRSRSATPSPRTVSASITFARCHSGSGSTGVWAMRVAFRPVPATNHTPTSWLGFRQRFACLTVML